MISLKAQNPNGYKRETTQSYLFYHKLFIFDFAEKSPWFLIRTRGFFRSFLSALMCTDYYRDYIVSFG